MEILLGWGGGGGDKLFKMAFAVKKQ